MSTTPTKAQELAKASREALRLLGKPKTIEEARVITRLEQALAKFEPPPVSIDEIEVWKLGNKVGAVKRYCKRIGLFQFDPDMIEVVRKAAEEIPL